MKSKLTEYYQQILSALLIEREMLRREAKIAERQSRLRGEYTEKMYEADLKEFNRILNPPPRAMRQRERGVNR